MQDTLCAPSFLPAVAVHVAVVLHVLKQLHATWYVGCGRRRSDGFFPDGMGVHRNLPWQGRQLDE